MKCWEFNHCGHEPGGANTSRDGTCPASEAVASGRTCWAVMGTLCHGSIQNIFTDKLRLCMKCGYFQAVVSDQAGDRNIWKRGFADTPCLPQNSPTPPPSSAASSPQPPAAS